MAKLKMYITNEVAEMCGCSFSTAIKYAQKPENNINFAGTGMRKIFIWFDDDIKRFKSRDVASVGRPRKVGKPRTNDFEINVTKNGKPRKLRLVNGGRKQYTLYVVYPPDQSGQVAETRVRYQPKNDGIFPDIKFYAEKNGFEIVG